MTDTSAPLFSNNKKSEVSLSRPTVNDQISIIEMSNATACSDSGISLSFLYKYSYQFLAFSIENFTFTI